MPGCEAIVEDHDPPVVGADRELVLSEDHPVGQLAAELFLPQLLAVWHDRAWPRDRDHLPGRDVVGATDDLHRGRAADLDHADAEPVGIGVLVAFEHLPDDEVLEPVHPVALNPLDLRAGHRQPLRQRLGVQVRSAVLV